MRSVLTLTACSAIVGAIAGAASSWQYGIAVGVVAWLLFGLTAPYIARD
jgi:hypothetical protein